MTINGMVVIVSMMMVTDFLAGHGQSGQGPQILKESKSNTKADD